MKSYRTTDYHTAGEPFRIVVEGVAAPAGTTVAQRRYAALTRADGGAADDARRVLCREPRGHADMYGCFLVPPDPLTAEQLAQGIDPAAFGALFWHKDGFSTACGHGTIALATWAVEAGGVTTIDDGTTGFAIDVPSGRVQVWVTRSAGWVREVVFANVPSWVSVPRPAVPKLAVSTSAGTVEVAVSYGGAFYASVHAPDLGCAVRPEDLMSRIVPLSREIATHFATDPAARAAVSHPTDDRLSGLYGSIWFDAPVPQPSGERVVVQRNVTIFADGEVDRSPCGSGTSARLAVLHADGELGSPATATELRQRSIIGTEFIGRVVAELEPSPATGGRPAVATEVVGSAYRTGEHTFVVDPDDPLPLGFSLR